LHDVITAVAVLLAKVHVAAFDPHVTQVPLEPAVADGCKPNPVRQVVMFAEAVLFAKVHVAALVPHVLQTGPAVAACKPYPD